MWEAAKAVHSPQTVEVRGWRIEWRPRLGHNPGNKRGDLYIFPPSDASFGWGRPIRSLSALHDVLLLRMNAAQNGGVAWTPPMQGSLVEVRVGVAEEAGESADDNPASWVRAEVRRSEPGLGGSFQTMIRTSDGDEGDTRWCSAWDEDVSWRRIPGQPLMARTRPGKRTRRCGMCAGCVADDCGECSACRDKPKFGGKGTAKQACSRRRCSNPTLPNDAPADNKTALAPKRSKPTPPLTSTKPLPRVHREYFYDDNEGYTKAGSGSLEAGGPGYALSGAALDADLADDDGKGDELAAGNSLDDGVDGLGRQVALAYQQAKQYRKLAAETIQAARALYPLAHAAHAELEKPECFVRPLESLPVPRCSARH